MGYLAIKQCEYHHRHSPTNILYPLIFPDSPRRFKLLHWISFLTSLCGVVFLLLARGHYTIDVILAYYVTTRLWWSYHTLAHNNTLRSTGDHNLIANECWWYPFRSAEILGEFCFLFTWKCFQVVWKPDQRTPAKKIQSSITKSNQEVLREENHLPTEGWECDSRKIQFIILKRLSDLQFKTRNRSWQNCESPKQLANLRE